MEKTNNYKCPACGGGLIFSPKTGKVTCEYCDSSYTVEEIESKNKVEETADSGGQEKEADIGNEGAEWSTDSLSSEWGSESGSMKEYSCPSCGASIICDKTTAATKCPYCDNPAIMEKQFSGALKPNCVIPFAITKKEAVARLGDFYKNKKFLPKLFSDKNHLEETKGIYVPFWFFDGKTEGSAVFRTTTTSRSRRGNTETITTRHFECERTGSLDFESIPVDASKKMPDDLMDSLEPFDFSAMKDFSTAYLPGYLADKFDDTIEECTPRAERRCSESFVSSLRASVSGYDSVSLKQSNITFRNGKVRYGLVPVWLLYTKYNGERFLFAVNGQTGKVAGTLPAGKSEVFAYNARNFLVSLAVFASLIALAAKFVI